MELGTQPERLYGVLLGEFEVCLEELDCAVLVGDIPDVMYHRAPSTVMWGAVL